MTTMTNTTMTSLFHSNQINAAQSIIQLFNDFHFVHLQAQMQSGKTGTCLKTAFDLIDSNSIQSFYVLSAISDLDLKNQWIDKITTHFDNYFNVDPSNIPQSNYYNLLKQLLITNVYFGKSINHIDNLDMFRNTLIIIDEIHYGASYNSVICKLFKRLNITSILHGEYTSLLEQYNIKILVVTATAANLDAIFHNTNASDNWGRVYMEPGLNYKGVLEYNSSNSIFPNFNINSDNIFNLIELLNKYKHLHKYFIFRAVTQKASIIIQVCEILNIPYLLYDQDNISQFHSIQPSQFTCVLIKSKLRVGKELNKQHICAVFETSLTINTDTLLQGLLGRVCGYNITNNLDIYISTTNISDILHEFYLINKHTPQASMTRTKFVKNYISNISPFPSIKSGSMHTIPDLNKNNNNLQLPLDASLT